MGWERFTDRVLEVGARERDPVFLLMGEEARRKAKAGGPLWGSPNVVAVPQPRYHAFRDSKPFSKVNRRLRELGRDEMDWSLEP